MCQPYSSKELHTSTTVKLKPIISTKCYFVLATKEDEDEDGEQTTTEGATDEDGDELKPFDQKKVRKVLKNLTYLDLII